MVVIVRLSSLAMHQQMVLSNVYYAILIDNL